MPMHPLDLSSTLSGAVAVFMLVMLASKLWNGYRARTPRLRILSGTRTQRAVLQVTLAPVLNEFLPLLDKAGQEVRAIVIVPTLSAVDGAPLAAEIEQLTTAAAFSIRLAQRIGSSL